MVSLQTSLSRTRRREAQEVDSLPTKKRRMEESTASSVEKFLEERRWRTRTTRPPLDVELHLETPLSSPPQQDRDIPLRQTHNFYDITRTVQKTASSHDPINLDLGLNLLCTNKSFTQQQDQKEDIFVTKLNNNYYTKNFSPGFQTTTIKKEDEEEEMVAKACMRCHMLVMLCKSSPSCPNCKFMHPPDHSAQPNLLIRARPSRASCVS